MHSGGSVPSNPEPRPCGRRPWQSGVVTGERSRPRDEIGRAAEDGWILRLDVRSTDARSSSVPRHACPSTTRSTTPSDSWSMLEADPWVRRPACHRPGHRGRGSRTGSGLVLAGRPGRADRCQRTAHRLPPGDGRRLGRWARARWSGGGPRSSAGTPTLREQFDAVTSRSFGLPAADGRVRVLVPGGRWCDGGLGASGCRPRRSLAGCGSAAPRPGSRGDSAAGRAIRVPGCREGPEPWTDVSRVGWASRSNDRSSDQAPRGRIERRPASLMFHVKHCRGFGPTVSTRAFAPAAGGTYRSGGGRA